MDVTFAVNHCSYVEPYSVMPMRDGTCWRLFGANVDRTLEIAVGIEAYVDEDGQEMIALCTVLPPGEKQ